MFSRFHNYFLPRRRWVLVASLAVQFVFIVAAAVIVTFRPFSTSTDLVPIALVAFQSSGQAVLSRILKYNALTSVVLTSNYCDLFMDTELFARRNSDRDQRVIAPVLLVAGAIAGGRFAHSEAGIGGALWTSAGLKLLIAIAWAIWPEEQTL